MQNHKAIKNESQLFNDSLYARGDNNPLNQRVRSRGRVASTERASNVKDLLAGENDVRRVKTNTLDQFIEHM